MTENTDIVSTVNDAGSPISSSGKTEENANLENVPVQEAEPAADIKSSPSQDESMPVSNEVQTVQEIENRTISEKDIPQNLKDTIQAVRDYVNRLNTIEKAELQNKMAKYDTDKYFRNLEFKELHRAAYEALGNKLDLEKFIPLLDKYVESRISAYKVNQNLERENQYMTDKLQFQSGQSKKQGTIPRMQDIPPEELGKYIYEYI